MIVDEREKYELCVCMVIENIFYIERGFTAAL